MPNRIPCQRDAGTRLATALRRRPFSACNKGNRRRLHAGNTVGMKMENVCSLAVGKTKFPQVKGKQTSTCLEIFFCDFRCSAVEVSCLKMALNEFNSLRKTFSIEIMTFSLALEMFGHYCM